MIKHTFSVVEGIGESTEKRLWRHGIVTWEDFINSDTIPFLNRNRKEVLDQKLAVFQRGIRERDRAIFTKGLKRADHWRLFEFFKDEAVYLDIETNGMSALYGGHATLVGLYDGSQYTCLIRGVDLTLKNLRKELSRYQYLVTFYGSVFDIPFLTTEFPALHFNMLHYDICLEARMIGLKGGLKVIEKRLGIYRDERVDGMDGRDAVRLWELYQSGNRKALDVLIQYNREDTLNLKPIGLHVYEELRRSTGIENYIKEKELHSALEAAKQ